MKRAFFDATTRRLKTFGLVDKNEAGDIVIDVPEDFNEIPGRVCLAADGKTIEPAPADIPDPRRVLDDAECEAAKIDNQIVAFLNMTPAQLDTWVDANITGTGPRTAFKILGRLAQNAARGKVLR